MTAPHEPESVGIVIPCYNHASMIAGAIRSAQEQTRPAAQIIVVDDGSTDEVAAIITRYSGVQFIRQENRGLAAARNAGLRALKSSKVIFLDADDQLLPCAVQRGVECFECNPAAAFVYGGYEELRDGEATTRFRPTATHRELLQCNWIAMVATVMFDRNSLLSAGGFDESLGMCEDWDAYLRLSRSHPFATHDHVVARYVRHRDNMSNDTAALKQWIEVVRQREKARGLDDASLIAWQEGAEIWASFYPDAVRRSLSRRVTDRLIGILRGTTS